MIVPVIVFIAVLFFYTNVSRAGEQNQPFSTIAIKLNALTNLNRNTFHNYWSPLYGGELSVELPFYAGCIEGGMHLYPYNGKSEAQPDFLSNYLFVGWGAEIEIISFLTWWNKFRIGNYQMHFDDEDINITQRTESELSIGLNSSLVLKIDDAWKLNLDFTYLKVFTAKRMELSFLGAGLSYEFETPEWIRDFMK